MSFLLNIDDMRELARRKLPRGLFEFVDRGSEDEVALRGNREALNRLRFVPRVMKDVSRRTIQTNLLGQPAAMPVVIAPTGAAGLLAYGGELALARAAASASIPFTLSTASLTSIEKVAKVAGRLWFQLYLWNERAQSDVLVERAVAAGCEALVVTVDAPTSGNREYNMRNGFSVPFQVSPRNALDIALHPGWLLKVMGRYRANGGMPDFENYPHDMRKERKKTSALKRTLATSSSVSWDDLKALRKTWPRALIVKGILHPTDAEMAIDCGANAVIVSNHGGRNLDSAIATMDALPRIVERINGRAEVYVDGGFRRGTDIAKALALGANAVMVGRAPLWGVAAQGEEGVRLVLEMLAAELSRVLAFAGCSSIADLNPDLLDINQ
jgi:isopentenyl diphosphate isomerase/L-lactate dehydrogenase-like FMN-dependent dehydrogenase